MGAERAPRTRVVSGADSVGVRELRAFAILADELHFGRTATRLDITASAVSQCVRKLERNLGVRLFERTSRRVSLTSEGCALLEEVRPLLGRLDDVLARFVPDGVEPSQVGARLIGTQAERHR